MYKVFKAFEKFNYIEDDKRINRTLRIKNNLIKTKIDGFIHLHKSFDGMS